MFSHAPTIISLVTAFAVISSFLADHGVAAQRESHVLSQDRLGPITIGMTLEEIKKNSSVNYELMFNEEHETQEDSSCYYAFPEGEYEKVSFMMSRGRLVRIDVDDARVRTARDLSVGSSQEAVLAAHRNEAVKIENHFYVGADGRYITISSSDGRTGILFEVVYGKVQRMRAGRSEAITYVEGCL